MPRRLLNIASIACLVLCVALMGLWVRSYHRFVHNIFVGDTGPVDRREEWPRPLLESIKEFDEAGLDERAIQVYCLCHGFDLEYVWRMDIDANLFKLLKDKWQLTQVDNPEWYILREGNSPISGIAPPAWWSPQQDGQTAFYVCPQELAKEKGDRFQVAFDPSRETIFVHYWFNF
jgi:hypothetical protein